jgi:hypothetical protein
MMRALILIFIFGVTISGSVYADDCTYKDNFGIPMRKGGCIVGDIGRTLDPRRQTTAILSVADALAGGDVREIKRSIGSVLVNSPTCWACKTLTDTLLPNMSKAQIEEAAGSGFLTFLLTDSPVLVVIDASTNIATRQSIREEAGVIPPPTAAGIGNRKPRVFSARPNCIVRYRDGTIYAGWKTSGAFSDARETRVFPDVDLLPGDTVKVTAPICNQWNFPSKGQTSLTRATIKFDKVSSLSGAPKVVKWFIYGTDDRAARRQRNL